MPVNYTVEIKTARMTATRDVLANGTLEILDGASVLVTFGLSAAGGTIDGDTWTLVFDSDTAPAAAVGDADGAQIKDSTGSLRVTGLTVGQGSGDISLNTTSMNVGQSVQITYATIQHAP